MWQTVNRNTLNKSNRVVHKFGSRVQNKFNNFEKIIFIVFHTFPHFQQNVSSGMNWKEMKIYKLLKFTVNIFINFAPICLPISPSFQWYDQ
jgi:hypothetical protein